MFVLMGWIACVRGSRYKGTYQDPMYVSVCVYVSECVYVRVCVCVCVCDHIQECPCQCFPVDVFSLRTPVCAAGCVSGFLLGVREYFPPQD